MRTKFFSQCDFDSPVAYQFLDGKLFAYTRASPSKTTANEDCIAFISVSDTSGVLLLADGLGGHPGGENASALIANIFCN